MHKTPLKKDLTNNELAEVILKKIDEKIEIVREEADENVNRLARIMMDKLEKVDEKLEAVEDKLEKKIDNLENKIDRRMSVSEDRIRIIKNVIEGDLGAQIAW